MDMRNWNGADDLPPLRDDDDNTRDFFRKLFAPLSRSGKFRLPSGPRACGIAGCASAAQDDAPYCGKHLLSETFDAIYGGGGDTDAAYPELPGWSDRRPEIVTLPEPRTPQTPKQPRPARELRLPRTDGAEAMPPTLLDDQCPYCRAVLIEFDEPIPPLREELCRALQGFGPVYVCPSHTARRVAHAETIKRINSLIDYGLSSHQIGLKFERAGGGYLDMAFADSNDD